jgi:hypothetical protein
VKHAARVARHGDPDIVITPDQQKRYTGDEHHAWSDSPTYATMHSRVARAYGRAAERLCAMGCGNRAQQWAYVAPRRSCDGMPFGGSPEDYVPLCVPCHKVFDLSWINA